MSNDALVGYAAGKAVMDKVNGDFSDAMESRSNQIAINEANRIATQAVNKSKASSRTQLILVNGVLDLKKALEQSRESARSWKSHAFHERTGKLAWVQVVKDLIKYKHVNKTFDELENHGIKYFDDNIESNLDLMDIKGKSNSDIEIRREIPLK